MWSLKTLHPVYQPHLSVPKTNNDLLLLDDQSNFTFNYNFGSNDYCSTDYGKQTCIYVAHYCSTDHSKHFYNTSYSPIHTPSYTDVKGSYAMC